MGSNISTWKTEDIIQLHRLFETGHSLREISEGLGRKQGNVGLKMHQLGLSIRARKGLLPVPKGEALIEEMFRAGRSVKEMAAALKLTEATIRMKCSLLDLHFRERKAADKKKATLSS